MKKKDKLIVLAGVAILVIASVGVYYWSPEKGINLNAVTLLNTAGSFSKVPSAISVSDCNPFYALIATPLAVHYDKNGNRTIVPLYIENMTEPSKAIVRTEQLIGRTVDLVIDETQDPKVVSLDIAKRYWDKSDVAVVIKDDREGYEIGIAAVPIASYLSAPVIVTDKIDNKVSNVLNELGVKYLLLCGNISTGLTSYKFESSDDVLNMTISLVEEKFGDVNYITLTNPLDAWPPKVLDRTFFSIRPIEIPSICSTMIVRTLFNYLKGSEVEIGNFTIPEDYKYALIKFEGVNVDSDEVDELRDAVL
ncbi:MAG: hypothetical protein J7L47_03995, partial [Candidatus Odinarchaeota archaeon]|nr:hypothetical protein [Candidatus Odinarchaeota archaeon]